MVSTVIEHDHDHQITGWKRWVLSTNHKDIGSMYLIFAIIAGIIGGIMSLLQSIYWKKWLRLIAES